MKQESVDKLLDRINRSLSALECGAYSEFDTYTIIKKLAWLYQFKYISLEAFNSYADRIIEMNHNS